MHLKRCTITNYGNADSNSVRTPCSNFNHHEDKKSMEMVKRKGISCSLLIQMCYYSFVGNNVALLGKHEMELDVIQLTHYRTFPSELEFLHQKMYISISITIFFITVKL